MTPIASLKSFKVAYWTNWQTYNMIWKHNLWLKMLKTPQRKVPSVSTAKLSILYVGVRHGNPSDPLQTDDLVCSHLT